MQIHPTKLVLLFCFPGAVFSKVVATIVDGDHMEDVEKNFWGNIFQRLKLRSTKRKKNRQIKKIIVKLVDSKKKTYATFPSSFPFHREF